MPTWLAIAPCDQASQSQRVSYYFRSLWTELQDGSSFPLLALKVEIAGMMNDDSNTNYRQRAGYRRLETAQAAISNLQRQP